MLMMKTRDIARSVLAAVGIGLALYVFFSARSCVRERQWLALGPIENHPVRIYDVKFAQEFNDLNDTQLEVARAIGISPVANREEAEGLKSKLVELYNLGRKDVNARLDALLNFLEK